MPERRRSNQAVPLTIILLPAASDLRTARATIEHIGPMFIDPLGDLVDIEPHELSDLDERDSALVDQPSDVPDTDAEVAGHHVDVNQCRKVHPSARSKVVTRHSELLSLVASRGRS